MRRGLLLLAVAVLVFVPSWAGAMPVLDFYGTGTVDATNTFVGNISSLSATGAPQNNGTYTYNSAPGAAMVQIFADLSFGSLYTDNSDPTATVAYTSGATTFNLPNYFIQFGGFAPPTPFTTTAVGGVVWNIWGMGSDMKANPSGIPGDISPFETFFGIDAVDDLYGFTFNAVLNQVTGLLDFHMSQTPTALNAPIVTPEPGTLLLLGLGLVGLFGVSRRKIF